MRSTLLAILCLFLVACGGGGSGGPAVPSPGPTNQVQNYHFTLVAGTGDLAPETDTFGTVQGGVIDFHSHVEGQVHSNFPGQWTTPNGVKIYDIFMDVNNRLRMVRASDNTNQCTWTMQLISSGG